MEESKKKIEKYMQEATERLNANDLDSAAFKVRKALEVLVKELCDEMEIEIKVKGKGRDSLNDILGKIKEADKEKHVLKYGDLESMYKVKQVGNIGSHDDDENHLEKATGEVKVRNAIDTMYLLLESLSDNKKLKLRVSVNTMLETAKKDKDKDDKEEKPVATGRVDEDTPVEKPKTEEPVSNATIVPPKTKSKKAAAPVSASAQPAVNNKKTPKPKKSNVDAKGIIKSIIRWDALIAIITLIVYGVGGLKFATYIGLITLILVDIMLVRKAWAKSINKRMPGIVFVLIAIILIALSGVGSYFISPAYAATRALNRGDSDSAKAIISQKIDGNAVQEAVVNRSVDSYYKKTIDDYSSGAIGENEAKKKLYPLTELPNSDTGKKAAEIIKSIDAYNQGKAFYDNKNYTDAISMLSQVSKDFPKYDDAQDMINKSKETYKTDLINNVGSPSSLDECTKALELLTAASEALPDDEDIKIKKDEVTTTYLTLLEKEVNNRLNDLDYEGAMELVSKAKSLLGDNETVNKLQSAIGENQPKTLSSFHIVNEDYSLTDDEVVDTYGNTYDPNNSLILKMWGMKNHDAYATYNVGTSSKIVKGTISVGDASDNEFEGTFSIEVNGIEVEKKTITRDTKPFEISVDVSDTDTITFKGVGKPNYETGYVILGDIMVY